MPRGHVGRGGEGIDLQRVPREGVAARDCRRVQLHTDHGHPGAPLLWFVRLPRVKLLRGIVAPGYSRGAQTAHRRGSCQWHCRDYGYGSVTRREECA